MDYECILAPTDKTLVDATGERCPLCNSCRTPDCTNPIKEMSVAVFGVQRKCRFWVVSNVVRQVISCQGYIGGENVFVDSRRIT